MKYLTPLWIPVLPRHSSNATLILGWKKTERGSCARSCLTLCDPKGYTVHEILQARILEWVAFPLSRDLPNPGIQSRSPALLADSLLAEPPGKPNNTGEGSLSLLQGGSSRPRNWTRVPSLQVGSLPTELSKKPQFWGSWALNVDFLISLC